MTWLSFHTGLVVLDTEVSVAVIRELMRVLRNNVENYLYLCNKGTCHSGGTSHNGTRFQKNCFKLFSHSSELEGDKEASGLYLVLV